MTSVGFISFIFAIGCSAWIYAKAQKQTGNNTATAVKVAAVCGLALWLISFLIFGMLLKK